MTQSTLRTASVSAEGARPSFLVKISYGLGQAAQSGGFDAALSFVFFFYAAVLGLSGALVGAALAVSLAVDAIVDPAIGSFSDRLRSRFGRRLPLMVVAAPLVSISVALIFCPPRGLGQAGLVSWLLATSVAARAFVSLFAVPYIALGAEMSREYEERTRIVVYRAAAGVITSVLVTAVGYSIFFAKGGLQRAESYPGFGVAVGLLLFVCMLLCCAGVGRFAAALPAIDHDQSSRGSFLGELREVFSNRSFLILFGSAVILFSALGLNSSLNSHAFVFVWKIASENIQLITYAYLVGLMIGVLSSPRVQRFMEKKSLVILGFSLLIANWLVLQGAMIAGLYLPLGDHAIAPMQMNSFVAGIGTGMVMVAYPSMMADACDEHQLLFGGRREGLYFAGLGFASKAATGVGVLLAGLALDLVRFPSDLLRHSHVELPRSAQVSLVFIWGPLAAVIAVIALVVLARYAISRRRHEEILAQIRLQEEALSHTHKGACE